MGFMILLMRLLKIKVSVTFFKISIVGLFRLKFNFFDEHFFIDLGVIFQYSDFHD